ncbi:MAG TPA: T9SS type A sorting domain-containing protein [Candidatus Kapabacteria bacterium]|nr:T9SS type A sorting domain-containing protein [Candidatus Kapabacteria bacterium]
MKPNHSKRTFRLLAAMLVLMLAGSGEILAQRFQWVYGSPNCVEAGRAGVTQLRNGGYVTVGESYSAPAGGCGPSHIYVIYTAANGAVVWSNIYTIGTSDSALDVVECCNGDLAICGVVTNPAGCNPGRDAFLLRLNNAGGVVAVHTYGTPNSDEIAWNLVEAKSGDGVTTNPGDLIVAGSTTFQAGVNLGIPARDGYIFRTTANLALIWDRHYGGPGSRDDYLYGIYECRVGVAAAGAAGDVVVTGGTNTWGAGGYDIWMLRVNGNNGTIGALPQNAATYGGPRDDEGRAIIELRFATNPGDLVVTGISFSRPGNVNSEVAMLQTTANPCVPVADHYAGDNDPHPDGGMDLKEDAFPTTPCGDVIVTGFTDWGGVINPPNVFLQRFAAGTMNILGGGMAYGGSGMDWGWSVDNCRRDLFCNNETEGYIVSGFTQSPNLIGAADPQQLYLIKTDVALQSGCNETPIAFLHQPANFIRQCPLPVNMPIMMQCIPNITQYPVQWGTQLCYLFPLAHGNGGGEGDGISGVKAPVTIPVVEGAITSYPNPLSVGTPLNLRFAVAKPAQIGITVTDIVGHVVYQTSEPTAAGTALQVVPTKGWPKGTYVVRVDMGETSSTTKVDLTD